MPQGEEGKCPAFSVSVSVSKSNLHSRLSLSFAIVSACCGDRRGKWLLPISVLRQQTICWPSSISLTRSISLSTINKGFMCSQCEPNLHALACKAIWLIRIKLLQPMTSNVATNRHRHTLSFKLFAAWPFYGAIKWSAILIINLAICLCPKRTFCYDNKFYIWNYN